MVKKPNTFERIDPNTLPLPTHPKVIEIRSRPYTDSLGDKELLVVIVLDDSTTHEERSWDNLQAIRNAVFKHFQESSELRFPYIRFRKKSELE